MNSVCVTPRTIPDANRNRLLVHVHGGGYVFGPGEAGLPEALLLSGFGGFKVISVDYRMPPDHPFRKMDNVVITPHLGYVSEQNYRKYFPDIVEDIRAWLDGKPVRVIDAK